MSGAGLRILLWCPRPNLGGGVRLLSRLLPAIAGHGSVASVRVATTAPWPELARLSAASRGKIEHLPLSEPRWRTWLARDGRIAGVKGTGYLKRGVRALLLRTPSDWVAARLRAAAHACDVVYVFWPHLLRFPSVDRPVVCTIQDTTYLDFPEVAWGPEAEAEWTRTEEWLARAASVVVSSDATRRALERLFGAPRRPVAVIHHAISPVERPAHPGETPALLRSLPARYVLYPANITAHKNHLNLLVAWARFARRRELPLVLCGEGTEAISRRGPHWPQYPPAARLAGAVVRLGLEHGADFFTLGYVSDEELAALIANATALVMPSLAEGGGSYPVEEALSMGVPVLCSDIPVMREHLAARSARVAWFDPYAPDDIVRALDRLFGSYAEFKESAVRSAADARPTWEEIGAAYVEVLLDAARERGATDERG